MSYKIIRIVDADEAPTWKRRRLKWGELEEAVLELKPNQTLEVEFDDEKIAERARNAVRDAANLQAKAVVCRTRIVKKKDGGAIIYLTRLNPLPPEPTPEP